MRKVLNLSGAIILILLIAAVLPLTLPKLFGFQLFEILSGSMEPTLPVHSVIYVQECDPATLQSGDIITFRLESGSDLVETHRVVSVDTVSQSIVTKGDANEANDQTQVLFTSVVGKVPFHLPWLGLLSQLIHSSQGIAVCVAIFAAVLLLWLLADRLKPKENKK
ncbi:MAG: signal peptidase I [Oscillospiraceae bacterium]|nr:signal peptidase I [Oscillospiraceae bacterium]